IEMKTAVRMKQLRKAFGDFKVIDNLDLEIEEGSITSILAPSGAGKTTLLRLMAGLDRPTEGHLFIDGEEVVEPNSEIGMMFQESSAFPWLSVKENIKFGLTLAANTKKCATERMDRKV